jgi:hypothetical protein
VRDKLRDEGSPGTGAPVSLAIRAVETYPDSVSSIQDSFLSAALRID